jgi:hypothetical protein
MRIRRSAVPTEYKIEAEDVKKMCSRESKRIAGQICHELHKNLHPEVACESKFILPNDKSTFLYIFNTAKLDFIFLFQYFSRFFQTVGTLGSEILACASGTYIIFNFNKSFAVKLLRACFMRKKLITSI